MSEQRTFNCILCLAREAHFTKTGMICDSCGHTWTPQDEIDSANYIRAALHREPITEIDGVQPLPVETVSVDLPKPVENLLEEDKMQEPIDKKTPPKKGG